MYYNVSLKLDIKINNYIFNIKQQYNNFIHTNKNSFSLNIYWIPSHIGVRGNEQADELAKAASNCESTDIKTVPFTDMYEHFKRNAYEKTQKSVIQVGQTKGKAYFESFYLNNKKPWYENKSLSREFIVTINRIRANHYNLAASLSRIGILNCAKCKCGYESEDINHILWQCNLYNSQRLKMLASLRKLKYQLPLKIEILVRTPDIEACKCIVKFLKLCNLKI